MRSLRRADNPALPVGPGWLPQVAQDATALGGILGLSVFSLLVVGFLCLRRKFGAVVSLVGGTLLSMLLKDLYARPRPDVVSRLTTFDSASFPSGHARGSATPAGRRSRSARQ